MHKRNITGRMGSGMGYGHGHGCKRGAGRGFARCLENEEISPETRKELFMERKNCLEERLEELEKKIKNLD